MRALRTGGLVLTAALTAVGWGSGSATSADAQGDATTETTAAETSPATAAGSATPTTVMATVGTDEREQGTVLFEESFEDDRNGWGIVDDPQFGSATFEDGDYVWEFRGSIAHWLPAVLGDQYDRGELDMIDVVVRAEATVLAGDGVVGVFCRENPDTDSEWQWYEFVARDGFAAIRRADVEGNLDVLAETDDVSLPAREPVMIEATCIDDSDGNADLTLTLNGELVLDATDDDPLVNGVSGLQAYTYPVHEQLDIRWHEFSIHEGQA